MSRRSACSNLLAANVPEIAAGVPFYGTPPPADQIGRIKGKMLLVFAGVDDRVNSTRLGYEAALKANGVSFEAVKYEGTQHGFNNDTTPRYDEAAAKQAWGRAMGLFERTLRG